MSYKLSLEGNKATSCLVQISNLLSMQCWIQKTRRLYSSSSLFFLLAIQIYFSSISTLRNDLLNSSLVITSISEGMQKYWRCLLFLMFGDASAGTYFKLSNSCDPAKVISSWKNSLTFKSWSMPFSMSPFQVEQVGFFQIWDTFYTEVYWGRWQITSFVLPKNISIKDFRLEWKVVECVNWRDSFRCGWSMWGWLRSETFDLIWIVHFSLFNIPNHFFFNHALEFLTLRRITIDLAAFRNGYWERGYLQGSADLSNSSLCAYLQFHLLIIQNLLANRSVSSSKKLKLLNGVS